MKDVVVGLGEIGKPIFTLISKSFKTIGYDKNPKLITKPNRNYMDLPTRFLHICIPYNKSFESNVKKLITKFSPKCIVIHSTIQPKTTSHLQSKLDVPIIYSPIRGVHKRMLYDLKRYTKFFAISKNAPRKKWACSQFIKFMKNCGINTRKMSNPVTLELAKIVCDTSYLGWLINYAQLTNMIAIQYSVNYDEMWTFSDEIHKFLGNRPKMYPGFIGGHCIIPNLDLMHNQTLDLIKKMNTQYSKKVKNSKIIHKKYTK